MSMSQSKFNRIWSGANAQMKKVYEVVPIAEYWPIKQIDAEMRRRGINADFAATTGILDSLKRIGVIREQRGCFTREIVREVSTDTNVEPEELVEPEIEIDATELFLNTLKEAADMDMPEKVKSAVKPKPAISVRLDKLIENSTKLSEALIEMSIEIDSIKAALKEQAASETAEMKKLQALKETLKQFIQ